MDGESDNVRICGRSNEQASQRRIEWNKVDKDSRDLVRHVIIIPNSQNVLFLRLVLPVVITENYAS